jgi:hypothetical protein
MIFLRGKIILFVSDVAEIIVLEHNLKNEWLDEWMKERNNESVNECEAATTFWHVALDSSVFIIEKHCMQKVWSWLT